MALMSSAFFKFFWAFSHTNFGVWIGKNVHFRRLEKPKDDEFCLEL